MIRVNLATGETLSFDLASAVGLREWRAAQVREDFQRAIRGVSIAVRDSSDRDLAVFAVPRPRGVDPLWDADIVRDGDTVIRELASVFVAPFVVVVSAFLVGRRERVPTMKVDIMRRGRLALPASRLKRLG